MYNRMIVAGIVILIWTGTIFALGLDGLWAKRYADGRAPADESVKQAFHGGYIIPGRDNVTPEEEHGAPAKGGDGSVAFDGENYLVVWEDWDEEIDIFGARVNQSGGVLDTVPIHISAAIGHQQHPAVVFGGAYYLVVWTDRRDSPSSYYDIYGARVDPSGTVLDPDGIAISSGANREFSPFVTYGNTDYLVVWRDERTGQWDCDIYGARVTQSGVVLDTRGIAISTGPDELHHPAAAFDGENYLVVWNGYHIDTHAEWTDIFGARVDTSGAILDPGGFNISTVGVDQRSPSIAFGGENYLVVWEGPGDRQHTRIIGAGVDRSGNVLDPGGIVVSTAGQSPSVAFDGQNHLVVWVGGGGVCGARVDQARDVLDPGGIVVLPTGGYPSAVFGGENYLVVGVGAHSRIHGARVNRMGVVLDPEGFVISPLPLPEDDIDTVFYFTLQMADWYYPNRDSNTIVMQLFKPDYPCSLLEVGICYESPEWAEFYVWEGPASLPATTEELAESLYAKWNYDSVANNWESWPTVLYGPDSIGSDDPPIDHVGRWGWLELEPKIDVGTSHVWVGYRIVDHYNPDGQPYGGKPWIISDCWVDPLGNPPRFEPCRTWMYREQPEHGMDNQWISYGNILGDWLMMYVIHIYETDVEEESLPDEKILILENTPNPFVDRASIRYQLPQRTHVRISIHNLLGQEIRLLVDEQQSAGIHTTIWDGRDRSGRKVPSGTYFLRLVAHTGLATGHYTATRKLCVVR